MSLRDGAVTMIKQCLNVQEDEHVAVVNDGNDQDLIDVLLEVLEKEARSHELVEYEEPENSGEEPSKEAAEAMKHADVFIAPTKKSISHTKATHEALETGTRGATLPTINKEVWNGALQADYEEIKRITEKVYNMLEDVSQIRVKTPSGTDIRFSADHDLFEQDTGIIHEPGTFGNLPAGETFEPGLEAEGTIVIDHLAPSPDAEGVKLEVRDNTVVSVESGEETRLHEVFGSVEGARNIAEFGFGTNPEATIIGNTLQDEKALGTVHIAFGDNSFAFDDDPRKVEAQIHWDMICDSPTVWFDDKKVLDNGEPAFL